MYIYIYRYNETVYYLSIYIVKIMILFLKGWELHLHLYV
jgi:hypothetical protein